MAGDAPRTLPPGLIVTGYGDDPEVAKTARGEGVVAVIRKPVIADELRAAVERLRGE